MWISILVASWLFLPWFLHLRVLCSIFITRWWNFSAIASSFIYILWKHTCYTVAMWGISNLSSHPFARIANIGTINKQKWILKGTSQVLWGLCVSPEPFMSFNFPAGKNGITIWHWINIWEGLFGGKRVASLLNMCSGQTVPKSQR